MLAEDVKGGKSVPERGDTRCKVCGTSKTERWIKYGDATYCSLDCLRADYTAQDMVLGFFVLAFGIAVYLVFPLTGFILVLFGLVFLHACWMGIRARHREGMPFVSQDSKKYVERMKRQSPDFLPVCHYCNHINESESITCQNCGASLLKAGLRPPSAKNTKPVQCPMCSAVYSYKQVEGKDPVRVVCQNCNMPFIIEWGGLAVEL